MYTPMPADLTFLEPWYLALRSPIGVAFRTNNVDRCKAKLYAARTAADDPQLMNLSIINMTDELWIVKRAN